MKDDADYKNSFPKIDVDQEAILKMLTKVAAFKMEERDLALDRFKRCNEDMEDDAFWLQGKTAIMYLDSASKASNYLGDLGQNMLKMLHKDEPTPEAGSGNIGLSDEDKSNLALMAESHLRERRLKEKGSRSKNSDEYDG